MESGNLGDGIYCVPVSDECGYPGWKYPAGYGDHRAPLSDRGTGQKSRKEIKLES